MNQDKKLIIKMPASFHKHLCSASADLNIGTRELVINSLLKELKALNKEYARPEDFKFRKFEARNKKND